MRENQLKFKSIMKLVKYPTSVSLAMAAICCYCLYQMRDEYSVGIRIVFIICAYFSSIIAFELFGEFREYIENNKLKLAFMLSWIYGTFIVSCIRFIDESEMHLIHVLVSYLLNAVWIFPVIITVFLLMSWVIQYKKPGDKKNTIFSVSQKIIMVASVVFVAILFLIAFNPAVTSVDSEACYSDAYNIILRNPIDNEHPFFYKFVLSLLMRINKSISFIIFCQILFYAVVLMKGIALINQYGIPKRTCIVILAIGGMSYNTIIQLITLWKDVPYTISMMWVIILIGEYILCDGEKVNWKWYLEFTVASVFFSYFRHGGIVPVTIVMIAILITSHNKIKVGICEAVIIILLFLIRYPLYNVLNVQALHTSGLKYSALMSDIQYVYYSGGKLSPGALEYAKKATDNIIEYDPFYAINEYGNLDDLSMQKFLGMYIDTYIHNPLLMTKGILIRNNYMWTLVVPSHGRYSGVSKIGESHEFETYASITIPRRKSNILTRYFTGIIQFAIQFPIVMYVYWRVGLYVFGLLMLTLLVISFRGMHSFKYAIPFLPVLINDFVLIVACAWPNYRYYWPNMVACIFLVPYGILVLRRLNEKQGKMV